MHHKYKPMVAKGLPCLQFFTQIPEIECYQCKAYIFETQKRNQYISTNIYLVSTQKCRLNETVLLSTQDIKPWL